MSSVAPPIPEDPQAIVRHLQMTNPEALALARDWEDVAEDLITAQQAIQKYDPPLSHIARVDHFTERKRRAPMILHWEWHISITVRSIPSFIIRQS